MAEKVKLADELSERLGTMTPEEAADIVDQIAYIIMDALTDDKVVLIPSVARFQLVTHKARKGHNPATGKPMLIEEHTAPNCHFSRNLRKVVYNTKHVEKKK